MEVSAAAIHFRRRRVDSQVDVTLAGAARFTAVAGITAATGITAAGDIMDPVSDSASAFTRLTAMPLRSAIPQDSMPQTACGNIIRVALCRTDIN
jgi:hypothetical protein